MSNQARQTIGVVGTGTMGRGIIQLFAQAGHEVRCFDAAEGAAPKAVDHVRAQIRRGVEKGRIEPAAGTAIMASVVPVAELAGLADCGVVIEAVVEDLGVKRALFAALEQVITEQAVLASNTSSLLVAEIAAGCRYPGRVAGLHFFNPVPVMKVAEIVPAVRTLPSTVETLKALLTGAGHRAVVAADQPGFLVNHAGRGFYTEGLRLLEEQVADPVDVDRVLRDAAGFRMGPFELLDLTGLDVSGKVMESIYQQFHQEPRFRPSSLVAPRIAAGLFGRKTGEGWYRYDDDRKQETPERPILPLSAGLKIWIDPAALRGQELAALARGAGAELVSAAESAALQIVQPWGQDATRYGAERGLDANRVVAVDPLPDFAVRRTLMLTVATEPGTRDNALALLGADRTPVTIINDSPGYIVQRVLATIVNIAANIAQRGIASVADLEDSVRIGLGYPHGPLSWGDRIGGDRVLTILRHMQDATGDPRYRPSPWLVRRVALNLPLTTPETPR